MNNLYIEEFSPQSDNTCKYIKNQWLVFGRSYLHPNHVREKFRKLLQQANLPPIHFHDLRHSAATILLSMGVNVKVIQELLGHTDISITLGVYGHLLPSMQQAVVETWDGVFGDKDDSEESGGIMTSH